jgi:hypothetical protein
MRVRIGEEEAGVQNHYKSQKGREGKNKSTINCGLRKKKKKSCTHVALKP